MQITSPCVVSMTWRLEDTQGQLIGELTTPVEFFIGGDDVLPKVEEALIGQSQGFETTLHLEPEHAFGDYNAQLVFFEKCEVLGDSIEPGMQFDGPPESSMLPDLPKDRIYTVTEIYDTHAVLDGNHPLAGIALRLTIKVVDVRDATDEEQDNGSVTNPTLTVLNTAPISRQLH
jgi:FKBP-type peptidyl-prolyl cis-trans isomerase SlyD